MDLATARALVSPAGGDALALAERLAGDLAREDGGEPPLLPLASAVRRAGVPADLAAAVTQQVVLRRRAARRLGPAAAVLLLTPDGAEQATRADVARRHAARYAGAGFARVADLCCGLGGDLLALAATGMRVLGVDRDPVTALLARANAEALGAGERVAVAVADALSVDLHGVDAVFIDPARRSGRGRARAPSDWKPPWQAVRALPERVASGALGAKLAPGVPHALVPDGVEAEWVSDGGDVVEAALWWGPLGTPGGPHRATLLPSGTTVTSADDPYRGTPGPPVGAVGRYLYAPDGAVVRAGLVGALAAAVGGHLLDPTIAYVTGDAAVDTLLGRRLAVVDVLPAGEARLRAALRERGVGRLEVLKRGWSGDVAALRRRLDLRGDAGAVLVLTRSAGRHVALLCQPPAAG